MKKFKTGLLALALVLGVSSAFVSKIHAAPKKDDPIYSWTSPDQGDFTGTVSDAEENYGCTTGHALCATGTADNEPTITLKKN
jgi:hypothetical protein